MYIRLPDGFAASLTVEPAFVDLDVDFAVVEVAGVVEAGGVVELVVLLDEPHPASARAPTAHVRSDLRALLSKVVPSRSCLPAPILPHARQHGRTRRRPRVGRRPGTAGVRGRC
jgi:hypothetical protein